MGTGRDGTAPAGSQRPAAGEPQARSMHVEPTVRRPASQSIGSARRVQGRTENGARQGARGIVRRPSAVAGGRPLLPPAAVAPPTSHPGDPHNCPSIRQRCASRRLRLIPGGNRLKTLKTEGFHCDQRWLMWQQDGASPPNDRGDRAFKGDLRARTTWLVRLVHRAGSRRPGGFRLCRGRSPGLEAGMAPLDFRPIAS